MSNNTITINSRSEDGNIFAILGLAKKKILKSDYEKMAQDVLSSASHKDAIARIRQEVELIDLDGVI